MSGTFQMLQNPSHPLLSEQNFKKLSLPGQNTAILGSGGGRLSPILYIPQRLPNLESRNMKYVSPVWGTFASL